MAFDPIAHLSGLEKSLQSVNKKAEKIQKDIEKKQPYLEAATQLNAALTELKNVVVQMYIKPKEAFENLKGKVKPLVEKLSNTTYKSIKTIAEAIKDTLSHYAYKIKESAMYLANRSWALIEQEKMNIAKSYQKIQEEEKRMRELLSYNFTL